MSLLDAQHLRKSYGHTLAVDDVSLSVSSSEVLGLLGPNGAGKTTTMMMLSGLMKPDAGTVSIDGQSFDATGNELCRKLGLVPQDLAVYADLTAKENLTFFGKLYGLTAQRLHERVDAVLEVTGLKDATGLIRTFSGGMRRRLNFGIALLHEPKLLILDEPTVGVDPQSRAHLLEQVRRLGADGVGVIYASHYMEEVQAICDRVAVMDHGHILADDTLDALLDRVSGEVEVIVEGWQPSLKERVSNMVQVIESVDGGGVRLVAADGEPRLLTELLSVLDDATVKIQSIKTQEANLEKLFLKLTGHTLRD
jgi:ABC-2 type transport system ATP-binding protein